MTEHVENCLSKLSSDGSNTQDGSDSDDEYETYTWCGQTRVRATSFLGQFSDWLDYCDVAGYLVFYLTLKNGSRLQYNLLVGLANYKNAHHRCYLFIY